MNFVEEEQRQQNNSQQLNQPTVSLNVIGDIIAFTPSPNTTANSQVKAVIHDSRSGATKPASSSQSQICIWSFITVRGRCKTCSVTHKRIVDWPIPRPSIRNTAYKNSYLLPSEPILGQKAVTSKLRNGRNSNSRRRGRWRTRRTFWANYRPESCRVKAEETAETAIAEEEGDDEHEEPSEPIIGQNAVASKLRKQQEQQ